MWNKPEKQEQSVAQTLSDARMRYLEKERDMFKRLLQSNLKDFNNHFASLRDNFIMTEYKSEDKAYYFCQLDGTKLFRLKLDDPTTSMKWQKSVSEFEFATVYAVYLPDYEYNYNITDLRNWYNYLKDAKRTAKAIQYFKC